MSKILLVLNHPNFKESFTNQIIVKKIKTLIPDIEFDHIDAFIISRWKNWCQSWTREMIRFFPISYIGINVHIFWVKWFEDFYEHGFAYGSKGDKLKYKRVIVSMTLNCRKDEFLGKYTIDKVISPWIATCDYTKQKFIGYENTYDIPF